MSVARRSTFGSDPSREYGRVLRNGIPWAVLQQTEQPQPDPFAPCPTCGHAEPAPRPIADGWILDASTRAVVRGPVEVRLAPVEWQLLVLLARRAGELVDLETIYDTLWPDMRGSAHTLTVTWCRLKKRLRTGGIDPWPLETVHCHGRLLLAGEGE